MKKIVFKGLLLIVLLSMVTAFALGMNYSINHKMYGCVLLCALGLVFSVRAVEVQIFRETIPGSDDMRQFHEMD